MVGGVDVAAGLAIRGRPLKGYRKMDASVSDSSASPLKKVGKKHKKKEDRKKRKKEKRKKRKGNLSEDDLPPKRRARHDSFDDDDEPSVDAVSAPIGKENTNEPASLRKKSSALDFFAKLREAEASKPRAGTIHAKLPEPVDEVAFAKKESQKSDWVCFSMKGAGGSSRYCEQKNHRHAEKCFKCGAMRRWETMRRAG